MVASNQAVSFGKLQETEARRFLEGEGYRIVECNYRAQGAEVDIIAKDADILCFIEVKARRTQRFGKPSESVHVLKQRRIAKAALWYLKEHDLLDGKARFDVVAIEYGPEKRRFQLIKNAFELEGRYTY